ncbi:MAG: pyridoxal-phosphate dependent enzyme [Acidobacteria bacterium]|nr:pyridoxal-phosphate dependent enzyme [Acidobacteriota bacterium]
MAPPEALADAPVWSRQVLDEARRRIEPFVHRTPVLTSSTLDERLGARVFFKCENFQKIGAFKIRGATNALRSMDPERRARGVVTHSSGNHAQAVALAARSLGVAAHVVMPRTAPAVKRAAVAGYGAHILPCEPTLAAREETTAAVIEETGAVLVHPYNDAAIIAGQATAAMELVEDVPGLDVVLVPVGGGGLAAGTGLAVSYLSPETRVVGAEPTGADDAFRSFEAGRIVPVATPTTIADGLLATVGTLTFPLLREHLERIVTVTDEQIVAAMRFLWERLKIVVEPSGAVPLAALLTGELDLRGRRVGVILSGGNVDLERLPWTAGG